MRVYQYDENKTTAVTDQSSNTFGPISGSWNRLGADIDGEAASDFSGQSVSLSSDGTILAIGANNNDGNGGTALVMCVYINTMKIKQPQILTHQVPLLDLLDGID